MVLLYYAQWCYCITHNGVTVLRTMVLLYYAQWCYCITHNDVTVLRTMVLLYYAQWCYCITHNGVTVLRTMVLLYYAQWWSDSESAFPFIVTQHKEVMPNGRFLSKGAECPG